MRPAIASSAALLALLCGGCTSDDYARTEGTTTGAGDAIAANTAMQMVDPWQYGVQNTKLLVPAARPSSSKGSADGSASAAASSQTASGN